MLRLFLRLYLILALVLALFFVGAAVLPNNLLKSSLADYIGRLAQGPRDLMLDRLRGHPQSQWPSQVERIAQDFGYPLKLRHMEELALQAADTDRLARGADTFVDRDKVQIWYLPLSDSPYVLEVHMGQSNSEHGRRMTIGTFHLIEERLLALPQVRWPEHLRDLAQSFGFPVGLLPLDTPELNDAERQRLMQGELLSFGVNTNSEWFYRRVGDSGQVLKLGPMTDPLVFRGIGYLVYGSLALMVALVVWLWVRPVWGGINELRRVTAAFGRGELQARASMPRRAPLRLLGETFNQMAERIQGLVDSHRGLTNAVSHELRTPIARLRFGLEMLARSDGITDRHRHLAGMEQDIGELEVLVQELLAFARFEREGCEPRTLDDLGAWLQGQCRLQGLREALALTCDTPPALQARLDTRLMARALVNLLRNAEKYAQARIRVEAGTDAGQTWIQVLDDGPGVPLGERERIFEPFARLDRSRDRETGGHGLGLAIVRRIMDLHGGVVEAKDSALGGACFRLQWPGG